MDHRKEEEEKRKSACGDITKSYRQMIGELIHDISNDKQIKNHRFEKSKVLNLNNLDKSELFRFDECEDFNQLMNELKKSKANPSLDTGYFHGTTIQRTYIDLRGNIKLSVCISGVNNGSLVMECDDGM